MALWTWNSRFLESLSGPERFHLTAAIFDGERPASDDVVGMPGMIMPLQPRREQSENCRTVTVAGPSEISECGIVPTAMMFETAE